MRISTESRRRIRLWLAGLEGWEAEYGYICGEKKVWLLIKRGDGEHWNPFTGKSLEHAAARMLWAHRKRLDRLGREVPRCN